MSRVRSARVPSVPPSDPRYEELVVKFGRLLGDQLAQSPCASDDEFFEKASFILSYGDTADDADWAALRLAVATRAYLRARSQGQH